MNKSINIKSFVSELSHDFTKSFSKSDADLHKISIVVPSFNQGRFLERTILSILNQNYPAIELIIIDGGSTDETLSIIQKYKKYIFYWISEPDNGQSEALNKGFSKATGEIYGWQNSDDIYLPGTFDSVARIFCENPFMEICYGNWYSINQNDEIVDAHYSLKPRKPHASYENMDAYNQTIFWRRAAHERFGEFDTRLFQLMDTDFIIRLILNEGPENFFKTDAFWGAFRIHETQKTDFDESGDQYFSEESYLEQKYNFMPASTVFGKYYRLRYRLAQLFQSLKFGGVGYTLNKFIKTYRRRGNFF